MHELRNEMRLYHFVDAKYGILNIKNRQLKIARMEELNDPFEFLGAASRSSIMRPAAFPKLPAERQRLPRLAPPPRRKLARG